VRFHVVSLPHTNTTDDFSACAFTEKVRKFCIMMHQLLGHEVFLYGGERNEASCTEHIPCLTEAERAKACEGIHYSQASFDFQLPHWVTFNANALREIAKRAEKKDFLCIMGGRANEMIARALPHLTCVEFGIGYAGTFSKFRVWESYAWMHSVYGTQEPNHNAVALDGHFFDAVIPSYFEAERFPFREQKSDYFLYMGRLVDRKGYMIAVDVCKHYNARLVIAGPGTPPDWGEYKGVVEWKERGELMSNARAIFVPTLYIEPFGSVAVEAQLCGTPAITTDWGAFTETVEQGKTGFRCRTLQEFIDAAAKVDALDKKYIRDRALEKYSLEAVAQMYQTHFERLMTLWDAGWYQLRGASDATEQGKVKQGRVVEHQQAAPRRLPAQTKRGHSHAASWTREAQGQKG